MELNHLRYFYLVAREGSFTRAAKILRVQQPTISKIVHQLEQNLNVILLERHKSGVRLTKAGGEIFSRCEDIFGLVDEIRSLSDSENTACQGLLSFGLNDAAACYVLPRIMKSFLEQHPRVRPSIFAGSSNLICNEIREGRIEFGVSFTQPDKSEFQVSELVQVPFQLVVATSQLRTPHISSSFIISRDIDYPKSRPFPVLEILQRNRLKVEIMITSNNLDSQKEMVLQGLGVALLPSFMVKAEIRRCSLTILHPTKDFSYTLKLITRHRKVLSRNALVFLDEFKRRIGDML